MNSWNNLTRKIVIVSAIALGLFPSNPANAADFKIEQTDGEITNQSVSNENVILAQNSSGQTQRTLKTGVYNAGSRYITIAQKGKRFCYEGVSIPPGRYAVAVGETIGSLSPTRNGFFIEGRKKQIVISQSNNELLVSDGKNPRTVYGEYKLFESNIGEISDELNKCLNSKDVFLIPVPGSGYIIK
jgi:hypothetical protein